MELKNKKTKTMNYRKHIFVTILAALLITSSSYAQKNQNEYTSIFNKKKDQRTEHGGYGAISFGYTNIDGKNALQTSVRAAWVIDHNIALGFAGYGFINNLEKSTNVNDYYLGGSYGGFFFEPIALPNSPIHVSFPILIGAGGITSIPQNYWDYNYQNYPYDYDVFFVFEPGVELELNMVKFFRIGLGASYRFTNGVLLNNSLEDAPVPQNILDGYNLYVNLKFGKF